MSIISFLRRHWLGTLIILSPFIVFGSLVLYIYAGLVIDDYTYPARKVEAERTIGSIHLRLQDADGTNLPPQPDQQVNDATVAGIDSNHNHIRDDVEVALFEKYPIQTEKDTAGNMVDTNFKARAASLQYAQSMQVILTLVDNEEKMRVALAARSAASGCVRSGSNLLDFTMTERLDNLYILNNEVRRNALDEMYRKYATSSGSRDSGDCDL